MRAEVIGTTIDFAFEHFLPSQISGFDLIVIDEAPDRAGYAEFEVPLGYLSDQHFDAHPVRGEDGEPDAAATAEARAVYKVIRDALVRG